MTVTRREALTSTRSRLRTEVLEDEGVVVEVLFPSGGVPFGESAEHERRAVGNRADDRWLLDNVPSADVGAILTDNSARIYGFDVVALQLIADRVGPTMEELVCTISTKRQ